MFGNKKMTLHLCSPLGKQGIGSLAQLVQSICLTSRGSGVRIPQLPQKRVVYGSLFLFFSLLKKLWRYL